MTGALPPYRQCGADSSSFGADRVFWTPGERVPPKAADECILPVRCSPHTDQSVPGFGTLHAMGIRHPGQRLTRRAPPLATALRRCDSVGSSRTQPCRYFTLFGTANDGPSARKSTGEIAAWRTPVNRQRLIHQNPCCRREISAELPSVSSIASDTLSRLGTAIEVPQAPFRDVVEHPLCARANRPSWQPLGAKTVRWANAIDNEWRRDAR